MCGHNVVHILIASLALVSLVSSELYHIVPTDSPSVCVNYTADSCMSLAQFAGCYVTSNDSALTLVFSPGEHTLSQIIHISNIHNVTLIGDSEQLTVINYVGDSGFELVNISSVLFVANLNMRRNGQTVLSIDNAGTVFINECNIVGKDDPRVNQLSAVKVHSALDILVSKSKFENNQMCYNLPDRFIQGSALFINTSHNVFVEESTFTNNSVSGSSTAMNSLAMGAAIYIVEADIATLINCILKNNTIRLFHGCQDVGSGGGGIYLHQVNDHFTVKNSTFANNEVCSNLSAGGAIYVDKIPNTITISGCTFLNNCADFGGSIFIDSRLHLFQSSNNTYAGNIGFRQGGAIALPSGHIVEVSSDQYIGNMVFKDGSAIAAEVDILKIFNSSYIENINGNPKIHNGGTINIIVNDNGSCDISRNNFTDNHSASVGGTILAYLGTNSTCRSSLNIFVHNSALKAGGAVCLIVNGSHAVYKSSHNRFIGNAAGSTGGATDVYVYDGKYISSHNILQGNTANIAGGAINIGFFSEAGSFHSSDNMFVENTAAIGGAVSSESSQDKTELCATSSIVNDSFLNNTAQAGGAISATRSSIQLKTGIVEIHGNRAMRGGGILLSESQLIIFCQVNITGNTATQSGGGIYAILSKISCISDKNVVIFSSNVAQKKGGGAALISSTLNVYDGEVTFFNNTAYQVGGALLLEQRSILYTYLGTEFGHVYPSTGVILVEDNSALYGGGVFVDDDTSGHMLCKHVNTNASVFPDLECFMQSLSMVKTELSNVRVNKFFFINNAAQEKGNDIYGGLLDRCTVDPNAHIVLYSKNTHGLHYVKEIATFNGRNGSNLTNTELAQHITSSPAQVCFCTNNKAYDCMIKHKDLSVRRGGTFKLMVTAVDQVHNQLAGTILAAFSNNTNTGHFKEEQTKRSINNSCTELEYNVYSDRTEVLIDLYAYGPCRDEGLSKRKLNVTFLSCTCPIGFQPSEENQNCTCSCDAEIKTIASCSHDVITLLSRDWVGFINESTNNTGLLVRTCPFDYCLERPVNISLSVPNGADMQCAFNRSNLLCGECKQGLSLVLGSSKCMKCTDKHLALLLPFAILGILLVALILVLNMTVAVGTINGLIFYANVVGAAQSVFFSGKEALPLKIFIAWLNFDFGIETCFYNGMTSTAKVFLQLVFPSYLILLTVIIIVLCECSQKFAALLGKRNPVATLCTLILLSYSKLLRMIIASLQFTYLSYPDHSSHIVWLYDANVPYFKPSHSVPLFLVSSIIIILGAVYTVLLFFGQWLPRLANRKMMKWIRHPKYNAFIDAYHAPFSPKCRYWVGLLLLARIVHNLVQALTADRSVTLLTTACIALSLVILKMMNVHTHKNWTIDTLESFFLVQLVVLSLGTYHVIVGESHGNQMALVTTSISVSFLIFVAITCYHLYQYVLYNTRLWMVVERVFTRRRYRDYQLVQVVDNDSSDEEEFEHASIREEPQNYTEDADTASQVGIDKCYVLLLVISFL